MRLDCGVLLREFLRDRPGPFHVVSPFISLPIMQEILREFPIAAVYTSWRPDHLLAGVSDPALFPLLNESGVRLVISDRLHAKAVVDGKLSSVFFGSANLTANGLGRSLTPNIEVASVAEVDREEASSLLARICASGCRVTPSIYRAYLAWLEANLSDEHRLSTPPPPDLAQCAERGWLIDSLPITPSPRDFWQRFCIADFDDHELLHDLVLFPAPPKSAYITALAYLRDRLDTLPLFSEIARLVAARPHGVHFGGVKELIQSNCVDLPTPWRRELTHVTQAFIAWASEVYPDRFEIVRPNHSQVLRPRRR
jgi:hypothetical protein